MSEELVAPARASLKARGERRVIAQAALVIMVGNVASRLLGMGREQVIAGFFGGGHVTDAFAAASAVPTSFYDLLIGGMVSAALVPVFTSFGHEKEERDLWVLVSVVLNLAAVALSAVVLVLVLLSTPLIDFYGADFNAVDKALATHLLQLMLPSVLFMGLSGVLSAYLYSRQRFVLPAFCAAAYNASIIAAAILLRGRLGVSSLAVGVLAGACFQILLQAPGLRGLHYRAVLSLKHPGVRKIGQLYLPVFLGLIVSNVTVAIDRNLASRTGEGSLAAMRFATTLIQMPLGLVSTALGLAFLPTLSAYAHKESQTTPRGARRSSGASEETAAEAGFKETLGLALRMVILLIVPAAAALLVLREPVIRLLYEHGAFNPDDTARTATAFLAYSPGLPAAAIDQLVIIAFYSRKNTVTPALVGLAGVVVYLAVALPLLKPLGMPGLALANSAQWIAHMLIMLFLLRRVLGGMGGLGLGSTLIKAFAAAGVTALTILAVSSTLGSMISTTAVAGLAAYVVILAGIGSLAYLASMYVLEVSELRILWRIAMAKLGR